MSKKIKYRQINNPYKIKNFYRTNRDKKPFIYLFTLLIYKDQDRVFILVEAQRNILAQEGLLNKELKKEAYTNNNQRYYTTREYKEYYKTKIGEGYQLSKIILKELEKEQNFKFYNNPSNLNY